MADQIRNEAGVEQLVAQARTNGVHPVLLELRDRDTILELQGTQASLLDVRPATDGEYELQRSGKVVVRAGRLQQIIGAPSTSSLIDPIG